MSRKTILEMLTEMSEDGLTLDDLAGAIGTHRNSVSRWRLNKAEPTNDHAEKIKEVYKVFKRCNVEGRASRRHYLREIFGLRFLPRVQKRKKPPCARDV